MDPLLQFMLILLSSLSALVLCIYYFFQSKKPIIQKTTSLSVPEVGGAWPVIGHMHLFGGQKLMHKILGAMADNYGPLFTIRLGSHKALVVNDWKLVKEFFTVHDKVFSGRPAMSATKLLGYDYAFFSFAPYGPYWREMRKITTVELLSNYRLDKFKHIRASEVHTYIKELYKSCYMSRNNKQIGVLVDLKQWFKNLTHIVTLRMVTGRRFFGDNDDYDERMARHYQNLIRDFFYLFGVFVLSDAIPSLGWLDFGGYKKSMKRTAKELDVLIGGWLEEHKQRRQLARERKEDQDFMDVMLTILEDANVAGFDTDTINKATCLNLIIASDSNTVPLTWGLSLLLNNPHVLKKIQEELDTIVGKNRRVEESDIKDLVYLQAVVKETMRLYPPAPSIPRAATNDCTLSNGYHVAAGTHIILNVWKIQHDERVWSNPNEFQPERFLTSHKDTDVRGLNYELIPFGSGRRSCAGISLALQVVHLTLASLLHSFDVATPSNEAVDMTESPGLTNLKATPLEVLLSPRLDSNLYTQ